MQDIDAAGMGWRKSNTCIRDRPQPASEWQRLAGLLGHQSRTYRSGKFSSRWPPIRIFVFAASFRGTPERGYDSTTDT
jgi:hypothetical protein